MSFEEQERALFDLLFDRILREQFCKNPIAALSNYQLDEQEQNDFAEIRTDGLELDANLRIGLLLPHLCKVYPITFSIVSSLIRGIDMLKDLVDQQTMRTPPVDRSTTYGSRLRDCLPVSAFDSENEYKIVIAILEAELGMVLTSATLKRVILEKGQSKLNQAEIVQDWLTRPIRLAPYVCAGIIPQPYTQLKSTLIPCADNELWRHLNRTPLSASQRKQALQLEDPRLLITRAQVSHMSNCEPTVYQQTVELAEGFAPLFQHVNGTACMEEILAQFKLAGAPDQLLESVQAGFLQLLENAMLELV